MAFNESVEGIILASMAKYSTINILELMALTPGLDDETVHQALSSMQDKKLVTTTGEGNDQLVSLTSRGYSYLQSQSQMMAMVA